MLAFGPSVTARTAPDWFSVTQAVRKEVSASSRSTPIAVSTASSVTPSRQVTSASWSSTVSHSGQSRMSSTRLTRRRIVEGSTSSRRAISRIGVPWTVCSR